MEPMATQAILACVIIAAALAVRTALAEWREPGSARKQWRFLSNPIAAAGGGIVFASLAAAVLVSGKPLPYLAWALLAGLLAALIADQVAKRD